MQATTTRPKITVSADGTGVVSHTGSRLLADLADVTTLSDELSAALARVYLDPGTRGPRTHASSSRHGLIPHAAGYVKGRKLREALSR